MFFVDCAPDKYLPRILADLEGRLVDPYDTTAVGASPVFMCLRKRQPLGNVPGTQEWLYGGNSSMEAHLMQGSSDSCGARIGRHGILNIRKRTAPILSD